MSPLGWNADVKRDSFELMKPTPFAIGLLALGTVLMVFPSLRAAGAIALVLAVVYWLTMAVLRAVRR
jgi:hypothetical protein